MKTFECKAELCKAKCCNAFEAKVSVGLGDLVRISEYTGEHISKIFKEKGDLAVLPSPKNDCFIINFSLISSPCVYLGENYKCRIQKVKPIECAYFPRIFLSKPDELKKCSEIFPCLKTLSKEKEEILSEFFRIKDKETQLELGYFWNSFGQLPFLKIDSDKNFFNYVASALTILNKKDPELKSFRSQRFAKTMDSVEISRQYPKSVQYRNDLKTLLNATFFCILEDKIIDKLNLIQTFGSNLFKPTSEAYKDLLSILQNA
ncbi:MAG: hypothetical protein ACOYT4_00225 [Nanoarchaeota archaeon]